MLNLTVQSGAFVAPNVPIELGASANDTRFNNSSGAEPTGTVAAARCSMDLAPWKVPSPSFFAWTATDGAFDSGNEVVETTIATTGLADGKHTLFCQAQDDGGQWGPVSAAFFWIMDPVSAPHVAGTVSSSFDGSAIEAEINVGGITSTITDSATGAYDVMIPEGTYLVTAIPNGPGFGKQSISDVAATSGSTTTVNFELNPFEVSLFDDAENGVVGWTAESPWALTTEAAHSTSHSWTDSPGGSYVDYADTSLTSAPLDLSSVQNVELRFFHTYETEDGYDYAIVEVSNDAGSTWSESARWDGTMSVWSEVVLQLPDLDATAEAMIRFRFESDVSQTKDGWHVDDITLRGTSIQSQMLFGDDFETGNTSQWNQTIR